MIEDSLVRIQMVLEEILAQVTRANSIERTGAVSSVQIEDAAKGPPRVNTKRYTGSDPEIEVAVSDHARAHRLAEAAFMANWEETVEGLKAADRGGMQVADTRGVPMNAVEELPDFGPVRP